LVLTHVKQENVDPKQIEVGYSLMSEENTPSQLIKYAQLAEKAGFGFITISDHYHPWLNVQGQSPFVWTTLGAIAEVTKTVRVGTAVTCPTMRIHPAIIAQAAATTAALMPGRFFLGVGTGENLNEHILGSIWPPHEIRSQMLEEAVEIMRALWTGKITNYYGTFYLVENARVYTLPEKPVPVIVAAEGPKMASVAGRIGDGLISTTPNRLLVEKFRSAGENDDLPCYCQAAVCYAQDEAAARKLAFKQWPIPAMPAELVRELSIPKFFEATANLVTEEQLAKMVCCGPDPEKHVETIKRCLDAGFRKISIQNIGHHQEEFFKLYEKQVIPAVKQE
jgi:coenzyme F420-dependent glucose-6-phosphate dehydrogenase